MVPYPLSMREALGSGSIPSVSSFVWRATMLSRLEVKVCSSLDRSKPPTPYPVQELTQ